MRILYIFPHPDDESFGPARAMAAQRRKGHDVYLLTLTRGEGTKMRHKFGWTLEQMGEARERELRNVGITLELADMQRFHQALDCYITFGQVIAETKVHEVFGKDIYFEIFREDHKPPLADLFDGLRA